MFLKCLWNLFKVCQKILESFKFHRILSFHLLVTVSNALRPNGPSSTSITKSKTQRVPPCMRGKMWISANQMLAGSNESECFGPWSSSGSSSLHIRFHNLLDGSFRRTNGAKVTSDHTILYRSQDTGNSASHDTASQDTASRDDASYCCDSLLC